ncbi:hypothetical protein F503_07678 [Ophiostoma piceae UAMH 11346]|uniref:Uncharacterized protein n=1 Tax=Ophiostoma piceae (strain UAMH 11346) TaxID=1262450 RepID=S3CRT5_OPHP1|nr:hypothetical protein F503_07678 [Ophiostoma piceae UAMH 11346]
MFGLFTAPLPQSEPPQDVPPPTPVNFPRYAPEITVNAINAAVPPSDQPSAQPSKPGKKSRLTDVLQGIVRPTELGVEHFEALGVRIHEGADPATIIPHYYENVPDFATWDDIPYDQAREINESTRRPISNGNRSPGIQIYLDRKRELSVDNAAAYRTVRRLPPSKPNTPPVRLGNAYEFYRHLDNFSSFWDDTSVAPPPQVSAKEPETPKDGLTDPAFAEGEIDESSRAISGDENADTTSTATSDAVTTGAESEPQASAKSTTLAKPDFAAFRTGSGSQMPPDYRLNMVTAFLKLVAYDFGCNVTAPRAEPRLYLNTGTITAEEAEALEKLHKDAQTESQKAVAKEQPEQAGNKPTAQAPAPAPAVSAPTLPASIKYKGPSSYFSSGCIFIFRSPTTREAARAGIVEGPLAAISARHTTSFLSDEEYATLSDASTDKDSCIDLARELVAALLTAQHRAREGRAERRIGKGEWWASRPRWGGGSGGPIGREVDSAPNTDEALDLSSSEGGGGGSGSASNASSYAVPGAASRNSKPRGSSGSGTASGGGGGGIPGGGNPTGYSGINTLAGITGLPMPKSASLSSSSSAFAASLSSSSSSRGGSTTKKQRKGMAVYDNYRMVRPPSSSWDKKTRYSAIGRNRSADYDDIFVVSTLFHHISIVRVRVPQRLLEELDGAESGDAPVSDASLRGLEVIRSPWYDFFKTEDRLAAMRLAWGMMAYLMRKEDDKCETGEDVNMQDA